MIRVVRNRQPESLGFRNFIPLLVAWRQDTECHEASQAHEVPCSTYSPWQCQALLQDCFDPADLPRKNRNEAAQCSVSGRLHKTTGFDLIPISAALVLEGTSHVTNPNYFSDLPVITCLFSVLEHL